MTENVLVLKDYKTVPDIVHEYSPTLKFGNIPLVIDNGKKPNCSFLYYEVILVTTLMD